MKTICLNMIVKDEEENIVGTLTNLCSYIKFDYWVISDTGSTDKTMELIVAFFKEKNIRGELVQHEWKHFGHNRTKALECAYNKTDYVFIFDADDKIEGNFKMPDSLSKDTYQLLFGPTVTYYRPLFANNRRELVFVGALHEYLFFNDGRPFTTEVIEGNYFVHSGRTGNRSKNVNKYYDDAIVLEREFQIEMDAGNVALAARYAFYCGQSYRDAGPEYNLKSIEWYSKVPKMNTWAQEKYFACLQLALNYIKEKDMLKAMEYGINAIMHDPERIEGLVFGLDILKNMNLHIVVNSVYNKYKGYNRDPQGKLFLIKSFYDDMALEYLNSFCAFFAKDMQGGYDCCKAVIKNTETHKTGAYQNMLFYRELLFKEPPSELFKMYNEVNEIIYKLNATQVVDEKLQCLRELIFPKIQNEICRVSTLVPTIHSKPTFFISIVKENDVSFRRTIYSILNMWSDANLIDYWFCVDKSPTKKNFKWIDYEKVDPETNNLEIIQQKIIKLSPQYWIHIENGVVAYKHPFIEKCTKGLEFMKDQNIQRIYTLKSDKSQLKPETIDEKQIVIHFSKLPDYWGKSGSEFFKLWHKNIKSIAFSDNSFR